MIPRVSELDCTNGAVKCVGSSILRERDKYDILADK